VAWTYGESAAIPLTSDQVSVAKMPDGRFLMIYTDSLAAALSASISSDPASFAAGSPVLRPSDVYPGITDAIIEDPELVVVGNTFHLWFSSRDCASEPCTKKGIGHATSSNGTTWTLESPSVPSLLRSSSNPASGGSAPAVIYDDIHCRYEMWLTNDSPATENDNQPTEAKNMVGVWHATSTNGTSWSINYSQLRDLVWDGTAAGEHLGLRAGADVAMKGSGRYLLYTGYDDQNIPAGYTLPTRTGTMSGVMTLDLATRDAP
jgi:hypothetical protein